MRRAAYRRPTQGVALFPFLAVLICTMGSLIVLLVLVLQNSRSQAAAVVADQAAADQQVAAEQAKRVRAQLDEADWRREMLEQQRKDQLEDLSNRRKELSHLEDHIRRLEDQWKQIRDKLAELQRLKDDKQSTDQASQEEIDKLREAVAAAKNKLDEARKKKTDKPQAYAIIPYVGKSGTRRRPIYIECAEEGIILYPERVMFMPNDFQGSLGPGNPLDAALRTVREYWTQHGDPKRDGEPYPLLIVRPNGAVAYSMARAAMRSWDEEFGYELIEEDMKLQFPPPDPQLESLIMRSITDARQRQSALAAAMPSRYRPGPGDALVASPNGGFVAAPARGPMTGTSRPGGGGNGSGGNGGGSGANGPAGRGFGANGGAAGTGRGTGAGFGGSDTNGNSAGGQGFGSTGTTGSGMGGIGGGVPGGGTGSSGTGNGAGFGSGGPGGAGAGTAGASAHGTAGSGTAGGTRGGAGATGGSGVPGGSGGPGGTASVGSMSGTGGGYAGGSGMGGMFTSHDPSQEGAAGQGAGHAASGSNSGGRASGNSRSGSASGGGPNTTVSGYAANGGAAHQSGSNNGASGGGNGGNGARSGAQAGSAGQSGVQADGSASPAGGQASVSFSPQSLAQSRGRDWALMGKPQQATAITRPIRVRCQANQLVLLPERGVDGRPQTIAHGGDVGGSIEQFVTAVRKHMDGWGLAVANGYWKPVLNVQVDPDAENQFRQLESLLRDSGYEVVRKTTR